MEEFYRSVFVFSAKVSVEHGMTDEAGRTIRGQRDRGLFRKCAMFGFDV